MTPRSGGPVLRVMRLATRPQSMIFLWLVGFQDRCGRRVPTIRHSPASLMGFSSKSVGANSLDGTRSRSETLGDARRERIGCCTITVGSGAGDDWRGPALLAVGGAVVRARRATRAGRPVRGTGALSRRRGPRPADAEGNGLHPRPRPGSLSPWGHALLTPSTAVPPPAPAAKWPSTGRNPQLGRSGTNARLVLAPLQND